VRAALSALVAAALVTFAASAEAAVAAPGCYGWNVSEGAAPLAVTFTSTCGAVHWSFGDGATADGEQAAHTFGAGAWAVDASGEKVVDVVSRGVTLRVPKLVGYRHRLTSRGATIPAAGGQQVLLLSRGAFLASTKTRANGTFSVTRRIRVPGPYAVRWIDARSESLLTTIRPQLRVELSGSRAVGEPLTVVARLVPAAAGRVRIRVYRGGKRIAEHTGARLRLDTRRPGALRVRVTTVAARGFATRTQALRAVVAAPSLAVGSRGGSVRVLEQRLNELRYALARVDGHYRGDTYDAVLAFQKVNGLPRTGSVDATLWRRLSGADIPRARYRGTHVEVDKTRQVLFEVRDGEVVLTVQVSTGATGNTPLGLWHVYSRVAGWSWVLYYPVYFLRGFAIHGYPSVPAWPASHGCVRVPMWVATRVFSMHPYGFGIWIYN